jgi:hypothetical protein
MILHQLLLQQLHFKPHILLGFVILTRFECGNFINDFYPFNRTELQQNDPDVDALLVRLWGRKS